jgi:hypothetical protein
VTVRREALLGACLLAAFAALALLAAARQSPAYDETAHLAAGLTYLERGDFRLNPEHPPLLKVLAALPARALRPWPEGGAGDDSIAGRALEKVWDSAPGGENAQWVYAYTRLYGPTDAALARAGVSRVSELPTEAALTREDFHNDADRLFFRARLPLTALAVLLGLLVWAWARELHGPAGGLLALSLFCFSPSFLAHAPLVTTDAGFSVFFFGAAFFWRRALRGARAGDAAAAAGCCALAAVSKFSAVLLAPALAAQALAQIASAPRAQRGRLAARAALLAAGAAVCGWAAIWAAYGLRFAAAPRASTAFRWDEVLSGGGAGVSLLRHLRERRLLPEAFIYGAAFTKHRAAARSSFLLGRVSTGGSLAFFPAAFALKTPLPVLALMAAGAALLARRRGRRPDLACLLAAPAVYAAAALASRLNIGHRHILPVYPFLFVAAGAAAAPRRRVSPAAVALGGAAAAAVSAMLVFAPPWRPQRVYPDFLAYFNEAAGGPRGGSRALVDSDLDWGQGLKSLSSWLARRGIAEPVNLCYFGTAEPRFYGVRFVNLPGGLPFAPQVAFRKARAPGWLAISATNLKGVYQDDGLRAAWADFMARTGAERAGTAGRSIFVYRLREPLTP